MKVLITGASGFLGNLLVIHLGKKYSVFGLSRSSGNFKICLKNQVPDFKNDFDLVIHAAGKAHSNLKSEEDKLSYYNVNVKGTQNLLLGLEKTRLPSKFIFVSSVAVYGLIEGIDITENEPLLAQDSYGKSKIEAEYLVQEWCNQHNIICTILRLPLIVGSNPKGNLKQMIDAIKKGFYFNVAGGNARKSMVLADDVIKVISQVAEIGGIYNLTDGYHPSFYELSKLISKQTNKPLPKNMPFWLSQLFAKIGDILGEKFPINSMKLKKITSNLIFDDTKARLKFGWKPTPVLCGYKIKN